MEYLENHLTYEDYVRLRESVGWQNWPETQVRAALAHSTHTITAICDGKAIGMGRLIGDGMYYTLVDVVVDPAYQGRGIGSHILDDLLALTVKDMPSGCRISIQLIAVKGKEEFYQKKGFKTIPHEFCGPGMRKIIHT